MSDSFEPLSPERDSDFSSPLPAEVTPPPESLADHFETVDSLEEPVALEQAPATKTPLLTLLAPAAILILVVVGAGLAAARYVASSTPKPSASPTPSVASPTPSPEPTPVAWDVPVADNLAFATEGAYLASPRPTATPKPSATPKASPSPTPSPAANLYFHNVDCSYNDWSSSDGIGKAILIGGKTFKKGEAPKVITCTMLFQNSESIETGEVRFEVLYDGKVVKAENVGTLKKGNWPDGEFKTYTIGIESTSQDVGEHTAQVRLNSNRVFAETNYADNDHAAKYQITE